jgi:hypothetical protein
MKHPLPVFLLSVATALTLGFNGCYPVPAVYSGPAERIPVAPGPEDMVLDSLHGRPRLLISCSSRRDTQEPFGGIIAYYPGSADQKEMIRHGEPPGLKFRPHGIYLDGSLLYVISHEKEPDDHPVVIYRVHGDSLEFLEAVRTPHQHSPNALVTGPEGAIYLVNDSGKRGSILEKMLKMKRASVVKLEKEGAGRWSSFVVAGKLGYPAGINRIGDTLFVGDATLHRIHVYSITDEGLDPLSEIRHVRGNDNLRINGGQLLTTGHVKPLKFIRHTSDPEKRSPVAVYRIDPVSGEISVLFYTDGSAISAGSTAVMYNGDLFISQIFEPFILRVPL